MVFTKSDKTNTSTIHVFFVFRNEEAEKKGSTLETSCFVKTACFLRELFVSPDFFTNEAYNDIIHGF